MFNSKIYTPLIYITYKRKQEEITKKCEMAVRQRCRFAVPSGHTPLFASTSLCSFGSQKMRSAAVRLCFAVPSGHTPLFASTSLCSFGSQKNAKCSRKAVLRHKSLWQRGAGKEPFFRKGFPRSISYTKLSNSSRAASNSSLNCSAFAVERLSSPMTVKSMLSS